MAKFSNVRKKFIRGLIILVVCITAWIISPGFFISLASQGYTQIGNTKQVLNDDFEQANLNELHEISAAHDVAPKFDADSADQLQERDIVTSPTPTPTITPTLFTHKPDSLNGKPTSAVPNQLSTSNSGLTSPTPSIPDWNIPDPPFWSEIKNWETPFWTGLSQTVPTIGGISLPVLALGPLGEIAIWIVIIIVAIALLALLIWFIRRWWNNRGIVSLPPTDPKPNPPAYTNPFLILENPMKLPDWLVTLNDEHKLLMSMPDQEINLQDTLLIGVGPAGREVLSQLAQSMNSRFGSRWPANLRILQIEIQPEGMTQKFDLPADLQAEQYIVLKPNFDEVLRNLSKKSPEWEHWEWYKGAAPSYDRARSRMALFYALKDGADNSPLWLAIRRAYHGLSKPVIRLIGTTFDDTSSGMLVDLIRVIQLATGQENIEVQLWLAGPVGREWSGRLMEPGRRLTTNEQAARTLATLRELERFQRNQTVSFNYVPQKSSFDYLRKSYTGAVVSTLFIFQPLKHVLTADPSLRSELPPEIDSLTCMADCIMALLNPQANQALVRHLAMQKAQNINNSLSKGRTSAIGSYSVRLPLSAIESLLAWRMVRDCLYEQAIGLTPRERYANMEIDGNYVEAKDVLGKISAAPSGGTASSGFDLSRWIKPSNRLEDPAFADSVGAYVQDILNGGSDLSTSVPNRKGSLAKVNAQLTLLIYELRKQGALKAVTRVTELLMVIQDWSKWFNGDLYNACVQNFAKAQTDLTKLGEQPARKWAGEQETAWKSYRQAIRDWSEAPRGNVTNEPLLRMGRHIGWQITFDGTHFAANFLITPREFIWKEAVMLQDLRSPKDTNRVLKQLYELAEPMVRSAFRNITPHDTAHTLAMQTWLGKAKTRLKASGAQGVNRKLLFIEPGGKLRSELADELTSLAQINVETSPSWDPSVYTLIEMEDFLSFDWLELYDDKAWQGKVVMPTQYVWPAEQQAAQIELARNNSSDADGVVGPRLSPNFTSWLARDAEMVRLTALGLIYEVFGHTRNGWNAPVLGKLGEFNEGKLIEIMVDPIHNFEGLKADRAKIIQTLDGEIRKRQTAESNKKIQYLKKREKELAERLENSSLPEDNDLGIYLRGLIELERNS